jgi:hypothetical protein
LQRPCRAQARDRRARSAAISLEAQRGCIPDASRGASPRAAAAIGVARTMQQRSLMQTHDDVQLHSTLQPLTDRDCEQVDGGAFDGFIRGAADVLFPVLICVLTARICA